MPATQQVRYPFNGLSPEQFFILLWETATALNWQMGNKDNKYMLKVPLSAESDSETLLVGIEENAAVIERKNSGLRPGNMKKYDGNLVLLTAKLNELRTVYTPEWLTEKYTETVNRRQAYAKDLEERTKAGKLTPLEKVALARAAIMLLIL
jgi:hypothetical protein